MSNKNQRALKGLNKKIMKRNEEVGTESTAAWQDVDKLREETNVSVPSLKSVEDAKDWVDNGSRL
ncbi:MAG: DUF3787 domain-containing protein [Clostridioides difficile]|nr:DUF3787 domain-containing protein [Clostridioides sp.]MBS5788417.1 DUF3787 domain-containing protein [Clostridioides difficile]